MDPAQLDGWPGRCRSVPVTLPLSDAASAPARRVRTTEARAVAPQRAAFASRSHERLEDRQFEVMEQAFARHGGMATAEGIVRLMRCRSDQPISELARWLVDRRVVQIAWQGHTLLPMFQFDRDHMTLRPEVAEAVRSLELIDDWENALWFATPLQALGNDAPVDALQRDPASLGTAARSHRTDRD